ncbi:MAG: NYN domain-containing protein [Candidatus Heimdallarchaeota archaeon]
MDSNSTNLTKIAVFWDLENCPPPSKVPGTSVIQDLRSLLMEFGVIQQIRAYSDLDYVKKPLRLELQRSGVQLIDAPSALKDAADKMILTDMLMFAIENPQPQRIVLISGDQDFAYTIARLKSMGYEIILFIPRVGAHPTLRAQVDYIYEWHEIVSAREVAIEGHLEEEITVEPILEVLREFWERNIKKVHLNQISGRVSQRYPSWRKTVTDEVFLHFIEELSKQEIIDVDDDRIAILMDFTLPSESAEEDRFFALLTILNHALKQGKDELELAAIGFELRKEDPNWQAALGVRKLKDYVLEAERAGFVSVRSQELRNYVRLRRKSELQKIEEKQVISDDSLNLFQNALDSLIKDRIIPRERNLLHRMRDLANEWIDKGEFENILRKAEANLDIQIDERAPNRLIYQQKFDWIDPSVPNDAVHDATEVWEELESFLQKNAKFKAKGRYFFAKALQESKYTNLSKLTLGELMLFVQHLAIQGWIKFDKGYFINDYQ